MRIERMGLATGTGAAKAGGVVSFWAGLAGILLLAGALRLPAIGTAPLWADEVATWVFAGLATSDLLGPLAAVEPNPPGYYLLIRALWPAEGYSEATLRLPSVVAGALAVVPLALATRAAFGTPAGLVAAALCALSASQIHHAQQARGYALLFLAAAAALWLLGWVLRPGLRWAPRLAAGLGFALACLVMLHLHATAVIAIAALFLHAAVVIGARRAWGVATWRAELPAMLVLALAGLLIALGAAWWLSLALRIATDPSGGAVDWIPHPDLATSAGIVLDMLGGYHLGRLKPLVAVLALGGVAAGAVLAVRRRRPEALGLLAAFLFGIAALHGISQVKPVLLDRTALVLLVFALPLLAFASTAMRPRAVGIALAAALLVLSLRGALTRAEAFAREGFREDWRSAVAALAGRAAPGDLVVLTNPTDAGALPFHAPGLAEQLRLRVVVVPGQRLGEVLLTHLPYARAIGPSVLCGEAAWVLTRETQWEPAEVTPWLFAGPELGRFGEVKLRRTELPPC